jgi:hypothetical protein
MPTKAIILNNNYLLLIIPKRYVNKDLSADKVPHTMKALSDVKSIILFQTIAASSPDGLRTSELNSGLRLPLKQFYTRMTALVNAGLVRRHDGRYSSTSYGKVIHVSLNLMDIASANYQKLVAIDTIGASNIANNMPEGERRKIVKILISNQQIRDVLLQGETLESSPNETNARSIQQIKT